MSLFLPSNGSCREVISIGLVQILAMMRRMWYFPIVGRRAKPPSPHRGTTMWLFINPLSITQHPPTIIYYDRWRERNVSHLKTITTATTSKTKAPGLSRTSQVESYRIECFVAYFGMYSSVVFQKEKNQ